MYKDTIQDIKDDLINQLKYYIEEEDYKQVEQINSKLELINEIENSALNKIDVLMKKDLF